MLSYMHRGRVYRAMIVEDVVLAVFNPSYLIPHTTIPNAIDYHTTQTEKSSTGRKMKPKLRGASDQLMYIAGRTTKIPSVIHSLIIRHLKQFRSRED